MVFFVRFFYFFFCIVFLLSSYFLLLCIVFSCFPYLLFFSPFFFFYIFFGCLTLFFLSVIFCFSCSYIFYKSFHSDFPRLFFGFSCGNSWNSHEKSVNCLINDLKTWVNTFYPFPLIIVAFYAIYSYINSSHSDDLDSFYYSRFSIKFNPSQLVSITCQSKPRFSPVFLLCVFSLISLF